MPFGFRKFKNFKKKKNGFYHSKHQKRKDEICPFKFLVLLQPTTVDKEPKNEHICTRFSYFL